MCASGGSAKSGWRLQPTDVWRVLYHGGLIDRRTFLLTPLALACAAEHSPNLLLITASNWRGVATPWDGDPDLIAPNLKKFGEQSVVFSRTYCASPKTGLAENAMLTSRFPHAAGGDVFLGGLVYDDVAGMRAFAEPFALRIRLNVKNGSRFILPDPKIIHPRENVPSDKEAWARNELSAFYASCRATDESLGEILTALDKRNLSRGTVVAFTSDCGLLIGSHGVKDGSPFEESVRIPLAIRYPRKLKPEARDLASQVDIMPTLLALCGMEIPDGVQGQDLFGKTPPEIAFAEGKFGEADEWRMLVRGYDKLIATPKGEITHLFNLADDPYEMTNLAGDPTQKLKLASLKAQLLAQMKKLGDGMDPSGLRKR
jgi:arylsulfatase A-like enzyme